MVAKRLHGAARLSFHELAHDVSGLYDKFSPDMDTMFDNPLTRSERKPMQARLIERLDHLSHYARYVAIPDEVGCPPPSSARRMESRLVW